MQIKHYKKGEAYIDTVVTVLLSLIVLALAISMFLFMYKYQKINDAAEDAVKYAAIVGEVNTDTVNQKTDNLLVINGVDTASTSYLYKTSSINSKSGSTVQYGDTILLEIKSDIRVNFSNSDGFITIPVKITKTAVSQKYYKPESTADATVNVSGGNVQRIDDVSEKPHNVNITVHGSNQTTTDDVGTKTTISVTNPTVSLYGKNLFITNPKKNSYGYEAVGSTIKITNPTSAFFSNTEYKYHNSIVLGKGTYTLSVEAVGEAELASDAYFQILYKLGDNSLGKGIPKINTKYYTTFTVDSPTVFSFNQVNMGKVPTSANLSVQIQLEVGNSATDFDEYINPKVISCSGNFSTNDSWSFSIPSMSPTMTIIVSDDNSLVNRVDVEYKKKIS